MTLTAKQQRFVEEYLVDLNATQAAIRAGYSEKTARDIGHENLAKPNIAEAIAEAQAKRSERTRITADMVLEELAAIAFADMGDYIQIGEDGAVRFDFSRLPEGGTRVIAQIVQEEYMDGQGKAARPVRRTKFKLYDKRAALVDIGRHLGMFNDRLTLGADDSLKQLMEAVNGRTRGLPKDQ